MTWDVKDLFVPAAGVPWLTRYYDPAMSLLVRERVWKLRLLQQVAPCPGERILDLGCGTGTLAIMLQQACLEAEIIGLDADREVLRIARAKAETAGASIQFWHGRVDDPLAVPMLRRDSFDKIVSSLLFHHLSTESKRLTFLCTMRLLRSGGSLHVADWGRPPNMMMRLLFYPIQALDGFSNTSDNIRGLLPTFMSEAGFRDVKETARQRTMFGSLSFYSGTKR